MCNPVRRRVRSQKAAARLVGPVVVLVSLSLLSCGVPLAASELTATAEVSALTREIAGATEASSRAADAPDPKAAPGALLAAAPASTIAPLRTASPQPSTTAVSTTPAPNASTSASPPASTTVSSVATVSPDPAATPAPSAPATDSSAALLSLLNAYRTAIGRPPLVANVTLSAAATAYAQYEGRTNSFGHTGIDGSVAETRIARVGYAGRFKGEALAAGQASADAAIKTWINSPSHNAIISSTEAVEVGIGYAYVSGSSYGHYWVLLTAVP